MVRILLAFSVLPGILLPDLAQWLAPALFPSLFCIMLFSFCKTPMLEVQDAIRQNKSLVIRIVCWQMIITPLIAASIMSIFELSGIWAEFILLTTCASSVFGAMAFIATLGLETTISMVCMLFSTAIMPIVLLTLGIGEAEVNFGQAASAYGIRIAVFIIVPALIGLGYRYIRDRRGWSNQDNFLDFATTASLVIFAIAIMEGVGEIFYKDIAYFMNQLFWILLLHMFLYFLTYLVFSRSTGSLATIAGILSAYRNLGLTMAILGPIFWDRYFFLVALWQIPMYLSPLLLSLLKKKTFHDGS